MVRNYSFNNGSGGSGSGSSSSSSDIESRYRVDCDEDSVGGDESVSSPSIWQRLALPFSSPVKTKDKHHQQQLQQASLSSLSESNSAASGHLPLHGNNRSENRSENLSGSSSSSNHNAMPNHGNDTPGALDDPTRPLLHPTPNQKPML